MNVTTSTHCDDKEGGQDRAGVTAAAERAEQDPGAAGDVKRPTKPSGVTSNGARMRSPRKNPLSPVLCPRRR